MPGHTGWDTVRVESRLKERDEALRHARMEDGVQPLEEVIQERVVCNCLRLDTISARELFKKHIPPIREIVPGLIVQGLTILGSPPKYGKSWLMLDLCLAVSMGSTFLGYKTNKADCLYLALEDSEQRLQSRINTLLRKTKAPEHLNFVTKLNGGQETTDSGLLDTLDLYIKEHPQTGLVVIDTLQKVRGTSFGRDGSYSADYREMSLLKGLADENNIALVLVHHLRKMGDDTDPFNRLSGTTGIAGVADTMIVLTKEQRRAETARLNATGRDIDEKELELLFDKDRCVWLNHGDTQILEEQREQEEYNTSPIVKTVRSLLEQNPEQEWTGTATQIIGASKELGAYIPISPKALSSTISSLEERLLKKDGIIHSTRKNGNAGVRHTFKVLYNDGAKPLS